METTVKEFFEQASEGKNSFVTPANMKLDINGHPCYQLERIHNTGFKYLIVPIGSPQSTMYWRAAQPTDKLTIFEERKSVEVKEPKTPKPAKKSTTTKVEKK